MMYMKQYTVSQLRISLKEALDAVVRGEEVVVTRLGQTFTIRPANHLIEPLDVHIVPKGLEKEVLTPGSVIEFCKHNQVRGFCKKGCK
jgi:hypothetical protein